MHIVRQRLIVALLLLVFTSRLLATRTLLRLARCREGVVTTSRCGKNFLLAALEVFVYGSQEVDLKRFLLLPFWPRRCGVRDIGWKERR